MSKHDDRVSLKDMLSHAREAVDILGTTGREELGCDRVMQLALTRLVEIIGEAANRVYNVTRQKYPDSRLSECVIGLFMDTMSLITIYCGILSPTI